MNYLAVYSGPGGPISAELSASYIHEAVSAVHARARAWYDEQSDALGLDPDQPVPDDLEGWARVQVAGLPAGWLLYATSATATEAVEAVQALRWAWPRWAADRSHRGTPTADAARWAMGLSRALGHGWAWSETALAGTLHRGIRYGEVQIGDLPGIVRALSEEDILARPDCPVAGSSGWELAPDGARLVHSTCTGRHVLWIETAPSPHPVTVWFRQDDDPVDLPRPPRESLGDQAVLAEYGYSDVAQSWLRAAISAAADKLGFSPVADRL